ncbi:phosphatidate cytidylyltransferase [Pseudomonas sp. BT76 TE3572]|uniref:Phosphatidate cytidylyltransferase n=1 Tax=Pseudomonas mandelii PD30 TaxID=1419583 RepID=A0A059L471_9PSED|nr:phosphatidate cytidylyltransferase [Pseudomonas mandelii]KDD69108.1 phosphatidate cytidylyltransferase [Pseudomonas mandelii PD30]
MLKQRIITALILLPIALCGFFLLEGTGFALFIGLVVTLGAWEWARLAGFTEQPIRVGFAAVVALMLFVMHIVPGLAPWVLGASVLWWGVATYLVLTYPRSSELWSSAACKLVIGLLILLPAWQGLVQIKQELLGNWLIMAVMVLVWGADIGAYFSGRAFGKRKLAPQVSPGKSWEGVYGGLAVSLVITVIVSLVRDWTVAQLFKGLMGAAIIVFISVVGDLTESMFKRQSGIKDSSNLLPGHGGVLDRIDSLTAAIPVFAVLLWMAAP